MEKKNDNFSGSKIGCTKLAHDQTKLRVLVLKIEGFDDDTETRLTFHVSIGIKVVFTCQSTTSSSCYVFLDIYPN